MYFQGWQKVLAVDMNYFYHNLLSGEEHHRVEQLEPFDEYEEWDLKCGHYIALTAANGSSIPLASSLWSIDNTQGRTSESTQIGCLYQGKESDILKHFQPKVEVEYDNKTDDPLGVTSQDGICHIKPFVLSGDQSEPSMSRFGHTSNLINVQQTTRIDITATSPPRPPLMVTIGGFGDLDGRHVRLGKPSLIDMRSRTLIQPCITEIAPSADLGLDRMYHTAAPVCDNTKLIVWGGRYSLLKPCDPHILTVIECLDHTTGQDEVTQGQCSQHTDGESTSSTVLFDGTSKPHQVQAPSKENQDYTTTHSLVDTRRDNGISDSSTSHHCDSSYLGSTPAEGSVAQHTTAEPTSTCKLPVLCCSTVSTEGDIPCARWRHTATRIAMTGEWLYRCVFNNVLRHCL